MFKTTLYHTRDVGGLEPGCAKRKPVLDGVYTVPLCFFYMLHLGIDVCEAGCKAPYYSELCISIP